MEMEKELKAIVYNIGIFSSAYDMVRIVGPIAKKVIYCDDKSNKDLEFKCYTFGKMERYVRIAYL